MVRVSSYEFKNEEKQYYLIQVGLYWYIRLADDISFHWKLLLSTSNKGLEYAEGMKSCSTKRKNAIEFDKCIDALLTIVGTSFRKINNEVAKCRYGYKNASPTIKEMTINIWRPDCDESDNKKTSETIVKQK